MFSVVSFVVVLQSAVSILSGHTVSDDTGSHRPSKFTVMPLWPNYKKTSYDNLRIIMTVTVASTRVQSWGDEAPKGVGRGVPFQPRIPPPHRGGV